MCAHVPQAAAAADISALRVLLVADLLARTAELGGLQVLTALQFSGPAASHAGLDGHADALGIHPPVTRTSSHDTPARLGGPIDVHLVSQAASLDPGRDELSVCIGAAHLDGAESRPDAAAEDLLAGPGHDPRSVRLALMSFPSDQSADLTEDGLASARGTLAHWRRRVAGWAESPSRTVSALALLRGVSLDAGVPAGAKFETFVYADRILGLDLARDIGQPVDGPQTRPHVPFGHS